MFHALGTMFHVKQVLTFDTDDPEFARGFEIGCLWVLANQPYSITSMMHFSNAEMIMRISEQTNRDFRAYDINEDWVEVHFPSK